MSLEDDRNTLKEFLRKKSFLERCLPVAFEQLRVYGAFGNQEQKNLLPDFCYNIFAVFRRTYFKVVPPLGETVIVSDKERLAACQSVDEAKQFVKIKFRHLGKVVGYTIRGVRFFDLELDVQLEKEGMLEPSADEQAKMRELVCGNFWRPIKSFFKTQKIGHGTKRIRKYISTLFLAGTSVSPDFQQLAYQWGPEAMVEFQAGLAEGMAGLLDENGQHVGEPPRANIYKFLLLAWPEIKEMQESNPRKTITDLHNFLQPFMRLDLLNSVDLDNLRDVCAPPSQHGIGLQLRPLSSRSASA